MKRSRIDLRSLRRHAEAGVTYVHPPKYISGLQVQWLPVKGLSRRIKDIRKTWYQDEFTDQLEPLDMIQWEARGADQLFNPYPDTVLVSADHHTVGILAGNPNYIYSYFFISGLALHPAYSLNRDIQQSIANTLLYAAVDFSQTCGFHGWVACHRDISQLPLLREFGFYPHDEFTYRKMGYFG